METDHEERHQELENTGDELEGRRDEVKSDTDEARQDIKSKVSDQRVPGVQDDQEDVIGGKDAVDEAQADNGEGAEEDSGEDSEDGGESGSEGTGYREDEE